MTRVFTFLSYPVAIVALVLCVISPYLVLSWGKIPTLFVMFLPPIICFFGLTSYLWLQRGEKERTSRHIGTGAAFPPLTAIGFALFVCLIATALLGSRTESLLQNRHAHAATLECLKLRKIFRPAKDHLNSQGTWPPSLELLFRSHELRTSDLPTSVQADVERLLASSAPPPDLEGQIESAIGVIYLGANASKTHDARVIIMRTTQPNSFGDFAVAFADGDLKCLNSTAHGGSRTI